MDKNKRGFTLIELLAVIVILAIIALIAVPVIMNVITKARISAFEDSAYGIVKAGEMYYTNKLLDAEGMTEDQEFTVNGDVFQNEDGDKLEISGSLPSSGKVIVTSDGKVALVISNGEYCIQKSTSESKVEAVKQANCTDYKKTPNPVFTTTTDGKAIPACITNNTLCDVEKAGDDGIKVGVKVNNTDEPIDFYVTSENADKGTITLIMNDNLGDTVAWASHDDYGSTPGSTDKGPITALNYLESLTSGWTNIPLETYILTDEGNNYASMTRTSRARMMTFTEATILKCESNTSGGTCPTWLNDNLGGTGQAYGYWLSSVAYSGSVKIITNEMKTTSFNSYYALAYGIRPVITVSKTIL